MDEPCIGDVFRQEDPKMHHHSRQTSLGVCQMYVLGHQQLKCEPCFERLPSSLINPMS